MSGPPPVRREDPQGRARSREEGPLLPFRPGGRLREAGAGLRAALARPRGRWAAIFTGLPAFALYVLAFGAQFGGGRLSLATLRWLEAWHWGAAALLALLVAGLAAVLVAGRGAQGSGSLAGAACGAGLGLAAPVLCCAPVIPVVLGGMASLFPAIAPWLPWWIQGFIATWQAPIVGVAGLLVALVLVRLAAGLAPRAPTAGGGGGAGSRQRLVPSPGGAP